MASKNKQLRSGFTTGACAAAAAKAAAAMLLRGEAGQTPGVEIPFPDGTRHLFVINHSTYYTRNGEAIAEASVIKDAGDDPDVTNGAEIIAEVRAVSITQRSAGVITPPSPSYLKRGWRSRGRYSERGELPLIIQGGNGVGKVTKPGLSVPVGEPAINPVPRRMIREAVAEALGGFRLPENKSIAITISVKNGAEIAKKTLNGRLGIIGGISILGTTGIVRPLSAEAWTASITAAMDVAVATGCTEVVLSTGRVSEKAHMNKYHLPVEAYVMMGDYVEFSFDDANKHKFSKIHLSAHWAKMLKIAMRIPQTHVRHGAIDLRKAVLFLNMLMPGLDLPDSDFNTAREIFDFISTDRASLSREAFLRVCRAAKSYATELSSGIPVFTYLVSYNGDIIAGTE